MGVSDQKAEENICMEEEETGGWGKPHTEELHNLCSSWNIIRVIKWKRLKLVGCLERVWNVRNVYEILFEELNVILSLYLKLTRRMTVAPEIHIFSWTFIPKCYLKLYTAMKYFLPDLYSITVSFREFIAETRISEGSSKPTFLFYRFILTYTTTTTTTTTTRIIIIIMCITSYLKRQFLCMFNFSAKTINVSCRRHYVTVDLPTTSRTKCVGMFVTCLHTKFHTRNSRWFICYHHQTWNERKMSLDRRIVALHNIKVLSRRHFHSFIRYITVCRVRTLK